ncbi:hypothetical protein BBI01_19770 [Chryseobacterium artocarpi]|uniref:Uncharacterized protein n=1 Tax=Chryseobacterium artocarpi TaxID=1414727 RepID=A0A1B8Z8Y9_9FLAO|nr:hypothetical protein [Chryseobacterium artocarpi]OCA68083.1 hypothetical protein BBI01_19770 [Chryseobacterium artocarpi]
MKPILYLSFLLCWTIIFSQKAVTDDGKEIMLFENRTWKPSSDLGNFFTLEAYTAGDQKVIISKDSTWKFKSKETEDLYEHTFVNNKKFTANKTASSLGKSKRVDAGFYYDSKKWTIIQEQHENPRGEIILQRITNQDIVASFGSFPLNDKETLKNVKDIVLTSFLMNPSHYKIKKTEFRTVNDNKIFFVKFFDIDSDYEIIQNYLITDDNHFVMLSVGSSEKDFVSHEKEMQDLINGLIKVKTEKYIERINVQAPVPPPILPKNQN